MIFENGVARLLEQGLIAAERTEQVESWRFVFCDTEVSRRMTPNWAAAVVNVLVLAFFAVCAIGVGLGAYAAMELKKAEEAKKQT